MFDHTASKPAAQKSSLSPLADRMRPRSLDQFVGQEDVVGPNSTLRRQIETDKVNSHILWGPPGSGKTTLATVIAGATSGLFIPFSAVVSGIKEVKEVLSKAANYYQMSGRRTYVFIDEIHRFNKAQQDAFLPYVEKGEVILIGATTENPSFEIISALLSRMKVYVLNRLTSDHLKEIIRRALNDCDLGLGSLRLTFDDDSIGFVAGIADGDARRALTFLDEAAMHFAPESTVTVADLKKIMSESPLVYDKSGEEHYNLISALHKTLRDGDPDAALYWLARMLHSGEHPLYIVRRLVRFATEDIGLADPYALTITLNAKEAFEFLGPPEGELAIAESVIYLACAPKSNATYSAYAKAKADAAEKGSLPVPLVLRNAPTKMMKGLGYGKGYEYAHNLEDGVSSQQHFPDELKGTRYYFPTNHGREARLAEYLAQFKETRRRLTEAAQKK